MAEAYPSRDTMFGLVTIREHSARLRPMDAAMIDPTATPRSPAERSELIQSAFPMIEATANALAGSRRQLVDELAAIGQLEAVEAEPSFDAARGVSFEAYVRPAVRGAMLDALRRLPSHEESLDDAPGSSARLGSPRISLTPEELVSRRDARAAAFEALEAATAELSAPEQLVLERYYVHGDALPAIARRLGVSQPTAKRWRQKALAWLRGRLARFGIQDSIPSSRSV